MVKAVATIPNIEIDHGFYGYYFHHNPSPMLVFDTHTLYFLQVNLAATETYGYSQKEFLSLTLRDIRPSEDIIDMENYVSSISLKSNDNKRWRHLKKDGSIIWVTFSSLAVMYQGFEARLTTLNNITQYKEQELALRLANKELKEYKKAITDSCIVSIIDKKGIIEYANDNFVQLTGYSREELIGRNHNIINSGYHPHNFWADMWNTITKGNTWRGEVCNRKKNGETYWADSFIVPIINDDGHIERMFSFRIDITARKNKETEVVNLNKQLVAINLELTESKKEMEKLSLVAKLTASEVMILNKDREIIWVNDAFTRLTGFTLAEAYGKIPSNLLHGPKSCEKTTLLIQEAIKAKKPFKAEIIHYTKDGKECHLLTDGQPVLDAQGSLLQYVIVETDITELKEKQEAVRNSEIKLNAFFSITANLHLLVDLNLNILVFNKVAEDFMRDIVKTNITVGDYLPAKLPSPIKQNFEHFAAEAIKGATTINRQAEITSNKGNLIWMVNYLPAYDRAGNIIGCAFTASDITASKRAEDKITRQNAILKEIAWKQSHIVRAPLANILAISSLLENTIPDNSLRSALKQEAEKLDSIIKDIVDKTVEAKTEY